MNTQETYNPKVSIITTYYNSVVLGDFVHQSMNSLLSQTYKNIEFICVHDGSPDDTLLQLKEYQKKDDRIIIIDKKNEGTAQYAKAAGQDAATGDFVMLFDHDDSFEADAIEKAIKTFREHPDLEMVGFIVKVYFSDGKLRNIFCLDDALDDLQDYRFKIMSGEEAVKKTVGYYDFHFRGLYRNEVFQKVSFRFSKKWVNADEIVERLLWENVKKIGSCSAIYNHYIYLNSSAKSFNLKKTDITETDVFLRKYFKEKEIYLPRSKRFELTAYKNLVDGVKAYIHYLPKLSEEDKNFYYQRLENSFNQIDKEKLLENYSGMSRIYNFFLSKSFRVLLKYYQLKK